MDDTRGAALASFALACMHPTARNRADAQAHIGGKSTAEIIAEIKARYGVVD